MAAANNRKTDENLGECRILIVGHSGSGKSTLGNKLLDVPDAEAEERDDSVKGDIAEGGFVVADSFDPGTKMCQYLTRTGVINGRTFSLKVVDTPGLFDPVEQDIRRMLIEITRSMALCCPGGPHVIMFVVPYGRFTEEKEKSFDAIIELFGEDVKNHLMIVFTHGEELQGKSIKEELAKCKAPGLRKVLTVVPDNHVVCSKLPDRHDAERDAILEMVGNISHNCTTHYSNALLMDLSRHMEREINETMEKQGLSYAQAIRQVRGNIIMADERSAFWNGLLKITARSGLFAAFVGIFWCVAFATVPGLIAAALTAAATGGGIAFGVVFSDYLTRGIAENRNPSRCNIS